MGSTCTEHRATGSTEGYGDDCADELLGDVVHEEDRHSLRASGRKLFGGAYRGASALGVALVTDATGASSRGTTRRGLRGVAS